MKFCRPLLALRVALTVMKINRCVIQGGVWCVKKPLKELTHYLELLQTLDQFRSVFCSPVSYDRSCDYCVWAINILGERCQYCQGIWAKGFVP